MNDEVKLILTKLKIVSEEKENGAYICDKEHSKILLSYIEQLENNRDKAIEYIEKDLQISILPNNQIINGTEVVKRINKIEDILKGDSDEFRNN